MNHNHNSTIDPKSDLSDIYMRLYLLKIQITTLKLPRWQHTITRKWIQNSSIRCNSAWSPLSAGLLF